MIQFLYLCSEQLEKRNPSIHKEAMMPPPMATEGRHECLSFFNNLEIFLMTILFIIFWGRVEHIAHQILEVFHLSSLQLLLVNITIIVLIGGILMFMLEDVIDLLDVKAKRHKYLH
jgi:hypothetical protein